MASQWANSTSNHSAVFQLLVLFYTAVHVTAAEATNSQLVQVVRKLNLSAASLRNSVLALFVLI
jgi:hypothetical protein